MSAMRLVLAATAAIVALGSAASRGAAQPGGQAPSAPAHPAGEPEQELPRPEAREHGGREAEAARPPQVRTSDVVRTNLEPSYLVYPFGLSGLDPLFFEANIAPHFFVGRPHVPFAFVLTPKILLRMFREKSEPVKTPSYMPRATVFVWFTETLTGKPQLYTSLAISHHSNGQTGDFYNEDGSINHDTGDFSTNFFELTLYATSHTARLFGWGAMSLEWHPDINRSAELDGIYGFLRLHFASSLISELPLHGALSARLTAVLDDFQRSSSHAFVRALERFPFSLRYAFVIPGVDLGFYVSYYFGHDYYNIWFDRLINVLQVGIFGGVAPTLLQTE